MIARFRAAAPEHAPAEYENTFTNARGERLVDHLAQRAGPRRDAARSRASSPPASTSPSTAGRRRRCAPRAAASSRPATRSAAGSSGTSTTAPSSGSSRSRSRCGSRRRSSTTDPAPSPEILAGASEELALALEELRELARGIHPAVLTDRGLDAALEGLAARTPLPVELERVGRRLPEPIEAAAYYVVSEAVTNVVKHASATSVEGRRRGASTATS